MFTIDTGVLIAVSRRRKGALDLLRQAKRRGEQVFVSANTIVEWWNDGREHERLLEGRKDLPSVEVVSVDKRLARIAGAALRRLDLDHDEQVKLAIDATVLATAATLSEPVLYTGDLDDMQRLIDAYEGFANVKLRAIP